MNCFLPFLVLTTCSIYLFYNSHLPRMEESMGFLLKEEVFQSGWFNNQLLVHFVVLEPTALIQIYKALP